MDESQLAKLRSDLKGLEGLEELSLNTEVE